jgi:hypothetical protein
MERKAETDFYNLHITYFHLKYTNSMIYNFKTISFLNKYNS